MKATVGIAIALGIVADSAWASIDCHVIEQVLLHSNDLSPLRGASVAEGVWKSKVGFEEFGDCLITSHDDSLIFKCSVLFDKNNDKEASRLFTKLSEEIWLCPMFENRMINQSRKHETTDTSFFAGDVQLGVNKSKVPDFSAGYATEKWQVSLQLFED
jgi:hypothetical protein